MRTCSVTNPVHTNHIRYEPFKIRTSAVTDLIPYELCPIRTSAYESAYEPYHIRTLFVTNFSIRTFCIRTISFTRLKHTNLILYEPFPLRSLAVTNLVHYESYPIRTLAYERLLTNLFLYEPSSGYPRVSAGHRRVSSCRPETQVCR